jgi:hypothetical protein
MCVYGCEWHGVTLLCMCPSPHRQVLKSVKCNSGRVCVYVCVYALLRVPPEEAVARGRSIDPKETVRGGGRWGQTPSFLRAHTRARAHTHTHTHTHTHIVTHTSHRASQAERRLRDWREAELPRAAGRRGRASGGSPRFRSPGRGAPRAHQPRDTLADTRRRARAPSLLLLPSRRLPAGRWIPADPGAESTAHRAPRTAHRAEPGADRAEAS